jgi:hypothetical protein
MHIGYLLQQLYTDEEAEKWLVSPHEAFHGMSAVQMIARARDEEVVTALRQILEGAYQ